MTIPRKPLVVFATVLWFALAAGLLEAAILLAKWGVFGRFTWVSPHMAWMAPVANVALLLGPAVVLMLCAHLWPRLIPLPWVIGALTLGLASCLLIVGMNGALAIWAVGLLGLGIAARVAQKAKKHEEAFSRFFLRTTPVLAGLVIVLAAAIPGWAYARERIQLARTSESAAPNVLVIILDTVRAISLSLYGHPQATTPNLDSLAAHGTVFDLAIAPAPWTLPSHGSMFTGRWPHELNVGWHRPLNGGFPTVAEVFQDRGYVTAGFTANHFYTTRQSGLDRGFIHYDDLPVTPTEILRSSLLGQAAAGYMTRGRYEYTPERSTHRRRADEIRSAFVSWLDREGDRPWFAFLNFFDAHKPYWVPASFRDTVALPEGPAQEYEQTIRFMDEEIGILLADLKRRGQLDNTIVIITSDHGEQFGRHRIFGHGNSLYRRVIRVPLIVQYPPRVPQGRRIAQPVSLRDLARTAVDLAGIEDTTLPGFSLAHTWENTGAYPDTILTELLEELEDGTPILDVPIHSLVTRNLQYIKQANGEEELYSMARDSAEQVNLADSAIANRVRFQFQTTLENFLGGRVPHSEPAKPADYREP